MKEEETDQSLSQPNIFTLALHRERESTLREQSRVAASCMEGLGQSGVREREGHESLRMLTGSTGRKKERIKAYVGFFFLLLNSDCFAEWLPAGKTTSLFQTSSTERM